MKTKNNSVIGSRLYLGLISKIMRAIIPLFVLFKWISLVNLVSLIKVNKSIRFIQPTACLFIVYIERKLMEPSIFILAIIAQDLRTLFYLYKSKHGYFKFLLKIISSNKLNINVEFLRIWLIWSTQNLSWRSTDRGEMIQFVLPQMSLKYSS